LCGKSVLERIIERIMRVACIKGIIVATTNEEQDDDIAAICESREIPYFRGSEFDVLDRIIQASKNSNIQHDYIIDITADCPLVCPEMIRKMISKCEILKPDYASNIAVRSFCDGFDVQIVKKEVLYDVYDRVPEYHRCHSAWNILAYAHGIKIYNQVPPVQKYWMPEIGLTLDTQMDLEVIRRIYEHFADRDYVFNHYDVYELILAHPEILDVNKNVKRKIPGKDES
jgi:spore coat polysaccharide biosynthesis protein SpsF